MKFQFAYAQHGAMVYIKITTDDGIGKLFTGSMSAEEFKTVLEDGKKLIDAAGAAEHQEVG